VTVGTEIDSEVAAASAGVLHDKSGLTEVDTTTTTPSIEETAETDWIDVQDDIQSSIETAEHSYAEKREQCDTCLEMKQQISFLTTRIAHMKLLNKPILLTTRSNVFTATDKKVRLNTGFN